MRLIELSTDLGAEATGGEPPFDFAPCGRRSRAFYPDDALFDLSEGFYVEVILGHKMIRTGSTSRRSPAGRAQRHSVHMREQGDID